MRKIMINCKTKTLDEFKRLAEFSKEIGATHLAVSHIEKSIWQWNADRSDPYPNWSMNNATIFKIVVPEGLKGFLPSDEAERNLEMINKRAEILKEYGLKAMFEGMEPAWLPEEVYLAHPDWRGPRCDQPRRTTKEYYAPCTDNEEVRQMYFEAVKKLCEAAPIEYFRFLTNDSGGGICWSGHLYPGANGPSSCRHISLADKVTNFLSLIQNAAAQSGIKAEAGFARHFMRYELPGIVPQLKDGQFVCDMYNNESVTTHNIGIELHNDPAYPITLVPNIVMVAGQMAGISSDSENNICFRIDDINNKPYTQFIKDNFGKMENSVLGKYNSLKKTAVSLIGEKYADNLVDIWDSIDKARDRMNFWNVGGHISMLGSVHQRWLTRPLVAFQSELTSEEKSYYRPFLFQATGEKDAENLVNTQGTVYLGGISAQINFESCSNYAISALKKAIAITDSLLKKDDIEGYRQDLEELKLRIRMYICLMINQQNVITFQSIIDRTDYSLPAEDKTLVNDEQGDKRLYKMQTIVRKEIENTYDMISIIDSAKSNVFICSETEDTEDIMELGPDIKNDLLKKIEIMNRHRMEFTRLYKSYNI